MTGEAMKDKTPRTARKKKKGISLSTILLVLILLAGLGILLYPTISDYWNSFHQTQAIANYDEAVSKLEETDYEALLMEARAYNESLRQLSFPFIDHGQLEEQYTHALDVAGNGIIGYVTISRIDVELPIYHGTSDAVLNVAVGHLEGSTLPVGGGSTHSVLSAHRGLPSAKLFTNLDKMEEGDTFTITVLNELLTYEVDQILIVEPGQLEDLNVIAGEDHVTLMTCTPYGINTHRLLVRGKRIANAAGVLNVHTEAVRIPVYIVMPAIAIPILFVLLLILLIVNRRKPGAVSLEDVRGAEKGRQGAKDAKHDKKEENK